MKRLVYIGLVLSCGPMLWAQTVLVVPYDATALTDEMKASNPDRLAYPTTLKENIKNDIYFQCSMPREEFGPFSVSSSKKVMFSPGNLQFNAAKGTHQCADGTTQPGTWRFAEHQWDYVGDASKGTVYENGVKCDNSQISDSYNGWVDLFGWGTSGWNGGSEAYQPYTIIQDNTKYGYQENDLVGEYAYADWGVFNAIRNGSDIDPAGTWRTLTLDELVYLFRGRENANQLFGWGKVNGVNGVFVLPDNWATPEDITFKSAANKVLKWDGSCFRNDKNGDSYKDNVYSLAQWDKMESAGAVFLPTTGSRFWISPNSKTIGNLETNGLYWSTTHAGERSAQFLCIVSYAVCVEDITNRLAGNSIRLVKDIPNSFSVSEDKQVVFSPGNLQYQASTNIWRFAEHQWDYVGDATNGTVYENGAKCNNESISSTYDGWIDLFGWGTGMNPTNTSTDNSDYYPFVDWGANAISNGGNVPNAWRTMTDDEWWYIFYYRKNAKQLFGLGTVNNVHGMIVLPDEWKIPDGVVFTPSINKGLSEWTSVSYTNKSSNNFSHNIYSLQQWEIMESNGAIFLPVTYYRSGTTCGKELGNYWSSDACNSSGAMGFSFMTDYVAHHCYGDAGGGYAVRLVQDSK